MSHLAILDITIAGSGLSAPGRSEANAMRLKEHLLSTAKRFRKLGVDPGTTIASALPDGPDSKTAVIAAKFALADFVPLVTQASSEQYRAMLLRTGSKLLLLHAGAHPAREAAHSLGIPVANVLRHFEAGIFTLETDFAQISPQRPSTPAWKNRSVPLVLIAPGPAYRRLASRLDRTNPVIGITPPSLDQLTRPHTIEHIAAECVRMLRSSRPKGPYAIAGWRADALVAVEMARLLEEAGEKIPFVAMLDAESLFSSRGLRLIRSAASLFRARISNAPDPMADALREYNPKPWFGKILRLRSNESCTGIPGCPRLDWRQIAPHGVACYRTPSGMLAEPTVEIVAAIFASELVQVQA